MNVIDKSGSPSFPWRAILRECSWREILFALANIALVFLLIYFAE